jgi:hypothetical protein
VKDALEIKWKEYSYLLKLGTIFLLDKPTSEIRNCSFDGRNVVQEASVFAGMIIDVNASINQVWLFCAAYSKERAVIDSFARHGVTLMFDRGDKWLITPRMVADMFKLKPIRLIDIHGEHIRDLVPDNYYNFRLHLDVIKKALPMIGSDERIVDFSEWQTRIFKLLLSINGLLDSKTDSALSRRQFPVAEDIANFQKQIASIRASEKFIPKKKPVAKTKSGGVAYAAPNFGFNSRHAHPRLSTNNDVTLNHIPYTRNESIRAAAVDGRYTTGHVGGFDAVDIHPDLFVSDPGNNRMEIYLEQSSDRSAIDLLATWGSILSIGGTPSIIMIDRRWNLSDALDRAVYSIEVFGDGQTLRLKGLPVDETNDASASIYQLIGLKWPNKLNQSRQAARPSYRTDLPVIKLRDTFVTMPTANSLNIEIDENNPTMTNKLGQPGYNIVLINANGRYHDRSYLVVDSSFLNSNYCGDNDIKHYKVAFTSHGASLALDIVYYIEYNSSNREELVEYLVANHGLPQQESEEVAAAYEPLQEPSRELARTGEIEFTLCDSVLAFSLVDKAMLVDYDRMPASAASKITAIGTVFAMKNRMTDRIESKWQVAANDLSLFSWKMTLKSVTRNPDLNGAMVSLRRLDVDEATSGSRPRPGARGGIVIPEPRFFEPRFVEPPTIGDPPTTNAPPAESTSFHVGDSSNYVVQSSHVWSQETYINGNWPRESPANEPVQNAASFWSQDQQPSIETQPVPTSVNGQVGSYQYTISPEHVVSVTIIGVDYEISISGFGINSVAGNCIGKISIRYRLSNSLSDWSDPFQVRWGAMSGWFVTATGLALSVTSTTLSNFLEAFYGTNSSINADQAVVATDHVGTLT